ncbi:helix-turn-helix transcriptional regulator [Streptococcus parauberis]|uniref:helix-turn-helix transcriptional regulator n=1 Tax=Streptococcus parauberis TaxID=1348 RepID=UPI0002B90DE0|nr:helix-turn-helix transcriptional regulator [Streptococcus parauberis]QBX09918.1 hypothetical protein JavanS398_0002 [Streptococcus satellite phage Javan398]EMF48731.1 transcriptional regulator, Cro/CI family [Streptococcus parauberis KRS-02109]UWM86921.1 helix-turn-helix domain-containing protein [Streptococcus parauberis]UWM88895.1 helix-turn-helix domain-containing protein [Streptococcus parauberis]WEM59657.1 helix-turn-helix transcriptional regulator [Streptococcus parauberis]
MDNNIKKLRQNYKRKLTQEELAKEIGVTKLTISRWENNERTPKAEMAQKLADFFNVSLGYILGVEDNFKNNVTKMIESGSDDDFYKTFKAYFELKVSDGKEALVSYKNIDSLESLRRFIIQNIVVQNFDELCKSELEQVLNDKKVLNKAEYIYNEILFSLGSLPIEESELLANYLFLPKEQKANILNTVKFLSKTID